MIQNSQFKISADQLQKTITLLSVIVACWVMYIQHGWINVDSVLYFEAARLFSLGEWKSGMQIFQWPGYPLLIAGLHYITSLDFQLCAQILTAVFFAIATHSLLRIIMLAGGDKISLILAALLLFSSSYIVGDVLPMLLRDQGFWAFLITALLFFIKYYRHHNIKDAFYWQLFAAAALIFRTETITYIAVLPLTLLCTPNITTTLKIRNFFYAYALYVVLAIISIIAVVLHGSLSLSDFERVKDIFLTMSKLHDFSAEFAAKAQVMGTAVLGEPLAGFAWTGLILTLISIAVIKCMYVAGLAPISMIVLAYNKTKQNMTDDVRHLVLTSALIAFINALLIILQVNILSNRYVIFFGFMLLIIATFSARALVDKWQAKQLNRIEKAITTIAILSVILGIVANYQPKNDDYTYEIDAVNYVKEQLASSNNNKVFYASTKARHYARSAYTNQKDSWEYTKQSLDDGSIYQNDILLINLDINEQTAEKEKLLSEKLPQYVLIKTFYGFKKKKRILVYKKAD
jgi:hypothetical protein